MKSVLTSLVLAFALGACAHANVELPPSVSTTRPTGAILVPGSAHRVVIDATACWFGGMWNDAVDDPYPPPRSRCESALIRAYDGQLDAMRVERLRAAEQVEVYELSQRVHAIAASDPANSERGEALAVMLRAIGAAENEQIRARRAADRIKMDIAGTRNPSRRYEDERAGAAELGASTALEALVELDAGDLTAEARTIGLMLASDRIGLAVDLPKHEKVLVVQGAIRLLFDLHPPPMPADPVEHLPPGSWLSYLEDVAKVAGHPVPASVTPLTHRERLAWAGMLDGIATKLRAQKDKMTEPNEVTRAAAGVCRRLEIEYRATEAAIFLTTP